MRVILKMEMIKMECLFCKIINGEIPAYKVYEDNIVLAFLDISPDSNGHTLIIPKKHYLDLDDIDMETLSHIMGVAKKLKKLLEEKLNIDGLTLIQNSGKIQEVTHFHLHLKPYYKDKQELIDIKETYKKLQD